MSGRGTERIEESLNRLFPNARIRRLDVIPPGRGLQNVIEGMRDRTIDILVGTQMVTKDMTFPMSQQSLFWTLMQVSIFPISEPLREHSSSSHRLPAGRVALTVPDVFLFNRMNRPHYALQALLSHDHVSFSQAELGFRRASGYPPFSHAATIRVDGKNPAMFNV